MGHSALYMAIEMGLCMIRGLHLIWNNHILRQLWIHPNLRNGETTLASIPTESSSKFTAYKLSKATSFVGNGFVPNIYFIILRIDALESIAQLYVLFDSEWVACIEQIHTVDSED